MTERKEIFKRLYWHSRRGMLELDLLLVPFAEQQLQNLDGAQLALYRDLLQEEDQDLFLWLTGRAEAPTPGLQEIVALVRQAHREAPARS